MKKVLYFFLKVLSILGLFAAILFVASKILEKKLVEITITEINKQVSVPIYIDDISFSLLKKFPQATITLKNVTINSSPELNRDEFEQVSAETLLFFSEIYLSINIMSIFDNKIELKKAYAQNGFINILTDSRGKTNYKINNQVVKESLDTPSQYQFAFMLELVQFKKIDVNFINNYKKTTLAFSTPGYSLMGSFYKDSYTLNTSGKLTINSFEIGKFKFNSMQKAQVGLTLNIHNNFIELMEGSITANQVKITTQGTIALGDSPEINLKVSGQTTSLNELAAIFQNGTNLSFSTTGTLGLSASITGKIDERNSPAFAANFKLVNGTLCDKKQKIEITNLNLEGSFTNGKMKNTETSVIKLKTFGLTLADSYVSGNATIENFNQPNVQLNTRLNLNLETIKPWFSNDWSNTFGGNISGNFILNGTLIDPPTFTFARLQSWEKSGDLNLNNGYFKTNNPDLNIQNTNAVLRIDNNRLSIANIEASVQNTSLSGSLIIADYFSPLTDSLQPWVISANLETQDIDYDNFKHFFENSATTSNENPVIVACIFQMKKAKYDVVRADLVSGELTYKNNQLMVPKIRFNAYEGTFESQVNYLPNGKNRYLFQTHTKTTKVNIKKIFTDYNNFKQTFIKDENIAGLLTADFDLELIYENGVAQTNSIDLMGHFRIDQGRLTRFQPILEISKFSEIEALNDIHFTTLENDLLIANSVVYIPKMEISSNAFDMSVYGTQWFSGNYEYHIRLNASDFVGGKSKRLAKQQSEFGYVEDDGYGDKTLYILATYADGESKVKLDGDEIKKVIKNDFKEEKIELKKALHDEFGWFKKDTVLKQPPKKAQPQEFKIEWDEQ